MTTEALHRMAIACSMAIEQVKRWNLWWNENNWIYFFLRFFPLCFSFPHFSVFSIFPEPYDLPVPGCSFLCAQTPVKQLKNNHSSEEWETQKGTEKKWKWKFPLGKQSDKWKGIEISPRQCQIQSCSVGWPHAAVRPTVQLIIAKEVVFNLFQLETRFDIFWFSDWRCGTWNMNEMPMEFFQFRVITGFWMVWRGSIELTGQ